MGDVRWQDGWGNVARSPQWRSPDRNALGHVEEEWAEVQQWEGNNSRAQEQQNNPRREDLSIEVMSPQEYLEQSEAFGDITRSPQSPEWHADDSPASPEPWRQSPSPARKSPSSPFAIQSPSYSPRSPRYGSARSPSPGEGPSHSRWVPVPTLSVRDPRGMTSERDPRKRARRHSPASNQRREEGLPGFNYGGPLYPSVQRSPSPAAPPFSPFSPPFSPHHESTEAAAGSRPGSPTGQGWTASPQASPPRHPYSPILFVRSPGRSGEPGSSPAYHPPGSQSPDVIDIDLEEMEPPHEESSDGRVLLSEQLREAMDEPMGENNMEEEDVDHEHQDEEHIEDGQHEAEGVSPEI